MTIPPFDPHSHTNRNHPETSFEAAELMKEQAPKDEMKMLWGWYYLGWDGGNYKEAAEEAAARRYPEMDKHKASPRASDCKAHGFIEPVLEGTTPSSCTCVKGGTTHIGKHVRRDHAFVFRITEEGCDALGVPYPFAPSSSPSSGSLSPNLQAKLDAMLKR